MKTIYSTLPIAVACILLLPQAPSRAQGTVALAPRTYQNSGLMDLEMDGQGNASRHHYGFDGSLRAVDLPQGLSRSFQSSQTTALLPPGVQTTPERPAPRPPSGDAPVGSVTEYGGGSVRIGAFTLGPDAKITELREGNIVTRFVRDAHGQVTSLQLPSGHRFDQTYDLRGNLVEVRDALLGTSTRLNYSPLHDQPVERVFSDGATTKFEYDAEGNRVSITSPEGRKVGAAYNAGSQLIRSTNTAGTVTALAYDTTGNLQSLRQGTNAEARTIQWTRDATGRITRALLPEGHAVGYSYFPSGGLQSFVDPDGNATRLEEDANGDLVALIRPGDVPARHAWGYDGLRRVATYTAPGQPVVSYVYNVHSDPLALRIGDQDLVTYEFNDRGQLLSRMERVARGEPWSSTSAYDDALTGRITRVESSDGIRVTPTYSGEITDSMTWSGAIEGSFEIKFDSRYRITATRVSESPEIALAYDADNLLVAAGELTLRRDPRTGWVIGMTLGVVSEEFGYNAFGELTSQTAAVKGVAVYSARHVRDGLGRVTAITETMGGQTTSIQYGYDTAGRLATVSRNGTVTETYSYDVRGNLVSDHLNGTYTYNLADQLLTAGGAAFTYTPTGERLTRVLGGATNTYHYTALSMLRGVELGNGRNVAYLHDGMGNRAARLTNDIPQQWFLCPSHRQPVAALDPTSGQILARYVHGLSRHTPEYIVQDGANYRLITDHLGNVRLVIHAETGAIAQQRSYDAYGKTLVDTAPGFQPFGFAGGWTDPDTGLIRFGARDYDPETRRWTTPDPLSFASGSLNLHAYVQGDPVNWVDPSGLNEEAKKTRSKVGSVLGLDGPPGGATVNRGGRSFQLAKGSPVFEGDAITASDGTSILIEFTIGGRASVSPGVTADVTGPRGLEPQGLGPKIDRAWNALDRQGSYGPQINTSGGTIGIEG